MMNRASFRNITALVLVGVVLSACGGGSEFDQKEFKRVTEKFKMKEKDVAAFKVCVASSEEATPFFKMGSNIMKMSSIPLEVCGCQTSTIVSVFKQDKLPAYAKFVAWVSAPQRKKASGLRKTDFIYAADQKAMAAKLATSLESCTRQYIAANEELGQKLLTVHVNLEQKKKDAEAKAAAEKKKSES
jgi:hypothetical protein